MICANSKHYFSGILYYKPTDLIREIYFKQDENEKHVMIFDSDAGILPIF